MGARKGQKMRVPNLYEASCGPIGPQGQSHEDHRNGK
jgi:hypothetical protein